MSAPPRTSRQDRLVSRQLRAEGKRKARLARRRAAEATPQIRAAAQQLGALR
jgi:hypothetical protein